METVRYRITGTCPLLTHNERLANPFDPITRQIKAITAKKKKTDEDHHQIFRLEWEGGLYFCAKEGPYLPGYNVLRAMNEAARLSKRGKDIERGCLVLEDKVKIEYAGPRTVEKLFEDGRFIDIRAVRIGQKKTSRARPKFDEWSATFTTAIDPEVINPSDVTAVLETAGQKTGIGDFRQRYGRFAVEVLQ
jgi:hypothetical protein